MISSIFSFDIVSIVIIESKVSETNILLKISVSIADVTVINHNVINPRYHIMVSPYGKNIFFINDKLTLINGPRLILINPLDCIIIDS